jgi:AraC family transcriptional regulator
MAPTLSTSGDRGRIITAAEIAGMRASEVEYAGGTAEPVHRHAHAYLILTLDGAIHAESGPHAARCEPRSVRIVQPDAPHRNAYLGSRVRSWLLELDDARFGRLSPYLAPGAGVARFVPGDPVAALVMRMYLEFARRGPGWELAFEALTLELFATLARHQAGAAEAPAWLERARTLLCQHSAERVTIAAIARQVGVHPVYLARRFRQQYGVTPNAYLRGVRLESARTALAGSRLGLGAIALRAGFSDQSQFTAHFRRHYGVTPAQYRRTLRPGGERDPQV